MLMNSRSPDARKGTPAASRRNPILTSLSFNYLWSNPYADNFTLCCAALGRPNFFDLVVLAKHLGVDSLKQAVTANDRDGWPNHTAEIMGKWYVDILSRALA